MSLGYQEIMMIVATIGLVFGFWQYLERRADQNRETKCGLLHEKVKCQVSEDIHKSLDQIHTKLNRITESGAAIQVRVKAIEESRIHNGGFDKLTAMVTELVANQRNARRS